MLNLRVLLHDFVGPRATKNDSLGKTEKLCLSREIVALVLE